MKAKKFCIIALVLVIALFIAPISENRAEEKPEVKTSGDYEYIVLDDGTACIKRYNGKDEKVIIPEKLDGIRVTGIGDYAFLGKTNLKEITISDSVESIGINPFAQCKNLLNINISPNHPTLFFLDNVLFYKPEKKIVSYLSASEKSKYEILDGIKIIGDSAFKDCYNLTEIKIPEGVQSIGDSAFSFCENLREIKIPEGVKSIGDRTFYYCYNLIEITIPESVKSIGNGAFEGCGDLTEITIPDSVEKIGENPFTRCDNLLNINISADHSTLAFIDNALFYKPEKKIVSYLSASKESKYEIPDGIESIGKDAFYGCKNLTEIKIPEGVQSIGYSAFSSCKNLTEIKISEGVKSIGDWAFSFCEKLRKIKIPDGVQSIGEKAFLWCKDMKKINIPASVNSIGKDAFEDCNNLTATVARDSYAEKYCQENNINYMYEDSLDWLKD